MRTPKKSHCAAAMLVAITLAGAGCSRPDPNPAIRVTGDRTAAVPTTRAVATTTTTVAPSTTYYYGPDGPGSETNAKG